MRIEVDPRFPTPYKIAQGVERLTAGEAIAYPTDSVYAIGCDAKQKKAVDALYRVTRKPDSQLLTLMCRDLSEASHYAMLDDQSYRIIRRLLPGPYCFILRATKDAPRHTVSKRRTLGVRIAGHPVLKALIEQLGHPLLSTSATAKGQILSDPEEIDEYFSGLGLVYDAGPADTVPSTVIDLSEDQPKVIREGLGPVGQWLA